MNHNKNFTLDEEIIKTSQNYIIRVQEINSNSSPRTASVVTFGCKQNEADSEKIMGVLESMGFIIDTGENLDSCDLIIFNTCAIREHAELKAFSKTGQLKHIKEKNRDLILGICGCMIEQEHRTDYVKNSFPYIDFTFGTHSLHMLPKIIYEQLSGRKRMFIREKNEYITESMPIKRVNSFMANVSVMYGCNNFCSYCIVPYVRGRERSRRREDILKEVRELADMGYKDITLLGQNVNSYNDDGYGFAQLLSDITEIDGDFLVRFLTSHPKDVPDDLIKIMGQSDKIAKHFHLPLQAGNDRILEVMNRKYSSGYFYGIVEKLRKYVPDIAITSDIIVGFPGENGEDFLDTMRMIEKCEFDNIFPFIFSKRKNTPAEKMQDNTTHKEKTKRFEDMIKLQNEIALKKNHVYQDKTVRALTESLYRDNNTNQMAARTSSYKLVVFEGRIQDIGNFVDINIKSCKLHALYGEIIH